MQLLRSNASVEDMETGIIRTPGRRFFSGILSTVFLESFTLTFLAEWGDRSQIATIILGAREVRSTCVSLHGCVCAGVRAFQNIHSLNCVLTSELKSACPRTSTLA